MIKRNTFLFSYMIFIIFSLVYIRFDTTACNNLLLAISLASLFLAIGDMMMIWADLDMKEIQKNKLAMSLGAIIEKKLSNKIENKYGEEAKEIVEKMSEEEKRNLTEKMERKEKEEIAGKMAYKLCIEKGEEQVKKHRKIAMFLNIIAFAIFPSILFARDTIEEYINIEIISNYVTVIAFLTVIITMILRNGYRRDEIEKLDDMIKEFMREIKEC